MSHSEDSAARQIPLLGICDLVRHRFRPIVTAITKVDRGRKEFEILMVCSRCGYSRNARQLQLASEQLACDVIAEAEQQSDQTIAKDANSDGARAETCDDEDQNDAPAKALRKKIN